MLFETKSDQPLLKRLKFYIFAAIRRFHSSMDRISDSGSEDLGSSPNGITNLNPQGFENLEGLIFLI
jgi:hypothetical protein